MKPFSKKEQYVLLLDELARLHQTTSGHYKEVHIQQIIFSLDCVVVTQHVRRLFTGDRAGLCVPQLQ